MPRVIGCIKQRGYFACSSATPQDLSHQANFLARVDKALTDAMREVMEPTLAATR
jgi:hypothetical protein